MVSEEHYRKPERMYHTRPISSGTARAVGRLVHISRRLFIGEAKVVDGDGREIARGSGTFMRSSIALTPEIGYR